MSLRVYTGRIPQPQRKIAGYDGADALNVSRASGDGFGRIFAPSPALLAEANKRKRWANGEEADLVTAWEWYAPRFREEMRASFRAHRPAWEALLRREVVTLTCYCGTAHRCHRRILAAEILPKLGAVDCGERTPPAREPGEEG